MTPFHLASTRQHVCNSHTHSLSTEYLITILYFAPSYFRQDLSQLYLEYVTQEVQVIRKSLNQVLNYSFSNSSLSGMEIFHWCPGQLNSAWVGGGICVSCVAVGPW